MKDPKHKIDKTLRRTASPVVPVVVPSGQTRTTICEVAPRELRRQLTDPDLEQIVADWPTLPTSIRAGIIAMVKAAK